jgi:hypothetical protein
MIWLTHCLKFWKCGELEVFLIRIKEKRLQNQENEGKLIWRNVHSSFKMFCSPSCFLITLQMEYKHVCLCLCGIFITVGVTLGL